MRRAGLLIFMLACPPAAQAAGVIEALKPVQTLDALQRVQDAIAAGDAGALPLQAELITIMDKSFAAMLNPDNDQAAELDLVLAFALAGGNRSVFTSYLKRANLTPDKKELVSAIAAYVEGDVNKAQVHFEKVEAQALHPRLAPLVALAKGTANIRKDPAAAIDNFDLVRLIAPGTLVEEVALRRTISLQAARGSSGPFLKASEQYARRFILSPYAAQFADAFVTGAVGMDDAISDAAIASVLGALPADRRNALYIRLARQAVISGRMPLAAFAAAEALKDGSLARDSARSAQTELYALIPELTLGEASALHQKISGIDVKRLPAEDKALLRAARRIVEAISQPFKAVELPSMSLAAAEKSSGDSQQSKALSDASADPLDRIIAANKEKLAAVDAMLEATR
jgi:chemotaxis protein MotC